MKKLQPKLLIALGVLFALCAHSGDDLPRATVAMTCNVDGDGEHSASFADTVFTRADSALFNLACDVEVVKSGDTGLVYKTNENADAFAISGPEPQVVALATTVAEVYPWDDPGGCTTYANSDVDAQVDMEFATSVKEKVQPTFQPGIIPTRILLGVALQATVTAPETDFIDEPSAVAIVQFKTKGNIVLHQRSLRMEGEGSNQLEYQVSVRRDLLYNEQGDGEYAVLQFAKQAYAGAYSDVLGPCSRFDAASSVARAFLDPVIEFDQERFDELYGEDSFPLADYYEILASPNLFDLLFDSGFEDYETL